MANRNWGLGSLSSIFWLNGVAFQNSLKVVSDFQDELKLE